MLSHTTHASTRKARSGVAKVTSILLPLTSVSGWSGQLITKSPEVRLNSSRTSPLSFAVGHCQREDCVLASIAMNMSFPLSESITCLSLFMSGSIGCAIQKYANTKSCKTVVKCVVLN